MYARGESGRKQEGRKGNETHELVRVEEVVVCLVSFELKSPMIAS